ncbi:MAG: SDR family oxidoreductase [Acidobacteriota bacterium]
MNLFVTGFPGFITRHLIPRLLTAREYRKVILLVEERFERRARELLADLVPKTSTEVVKGDITQNDLALSDERVRGLLLREETEWWHLAALYRLDADLRSARRVNVDGTRNVLAAARAAAPNVTRFNYVSTAYVSGWRTGRVGEDDLPRAQPENFKNHYELTKNEAEWLVRSEREHLPITIYRFGIVVGDSRTGATDKFDGPYFSIKYLHRWGHLPLPRVGPMKAAINMVPVDFVVEACALISGRPDSSGKCFQIVDPDPISTRQLFELTARYLGRRRMAWTLSPTWMERLVKQRWLRKRIAIPKEAIAYMNHPVHYDCSNTLEALRDTGCRCPRAEEYLPAMIEFYLANRGREELHLKVD